MAGRRDCGPVLRARRVGRRRQPVGVARGAATESGWSFTFAHPSSPVTLRGMVQLRWRKGGVVVKTVELATEAGHRSSAGADPADYSAATCTLGS